MAEAHLDHPGEISWFKGYGPLPVLGPCPHAECNHLGDGVIAWGPTMERFGLVTCGSIRPADESPGDCAGHCRAWVDDRGRQVTPWLNVDLSASAADVLHAE
jgi:hypothetical protein